MEDGKSEYLHQIEIHSIGDYLHEVNKLQEEWRLAEKDRISDYLASAWFRGSWNCRYNLLPSFHRFSQKYPGTTEDDLRDEFTRRAHPLLEQKIPADHWEWYFLLQHYDLPTRLLDWSVSSLVGLFFGVYDYRLLKADWSKSIDDEALCDASVWMMDSETLNRHTLGEHFSEIEPILRYDSPCLANYLAKRPFDTLTWPPNPVAILPAYTNRRLVSQKGTFVLFGADKTPLDQGNYWVVNEKPRLIQFIIPKDVVPQIRSALINTGITASLLFPELSMLSTDILHDWCR